MTNFLALLYVLMCFVYSYKHISNHDPPPLHNMILAVDTAQHYETNDNTVLQMIVYMDSTICHKCMLVNSGKWMAFQELDDKTVHKFKFSYALVPQIRDRIIVEYIKAMKLQENVYFDYGQEFPHWISAYDEFEEGKPFVVLLDNQNKVLLMGNPLEEADTLIEYRHFIQSYLNISL